MPHAVYMHSGLVLDRHGHPDHGSHRRLLLRITRWDVVLAMAVAGTVNAAMLLVAAINLQDRNVSASIEGAYSAIHNTLGRPSRCCSRSVSSRPGWRPRRWAPTPAP